MASVAAAAALAFNLVCNGTHREVSLGRDTTEPYQNTFRVDLSNNKWCSADCRVATPLAEVRPDLISFIDTDESKVDHEFKYSLFVDRTTGKLSGISIYRAVGFPIRDALQSYGRADMENWDAVCVKAAFTGFPVPAATKF